MTLTVWTKGDEVSLHQLSDDPADGTPQEQVAFLFLLDAFAGYTCVSADYTAAIPDVNASLLRWNGAQITATVPIPESITPRQVRLLLLGQGLLDQVEAMIKTQDKAAQITWEFASEFRRDNPLLTALGANLGLTVAQIDQFFIAAAAL